MFVLYMYLVCDNKSTDKYDKGVYLSCSSYENGSIMGPEVQNRIVPKYKQTNKQTTFFPMINRIRRDQKPIPLIQAHVL